MRPLSLGLCIFISATTLSAASAVPSYTRPEEFVTTSAVPTPGGATSVATIGDKSLVLTATRYEYGHTLMLVDDEGQPLWPASLQVSAKAIAASGRTFLTAGGFAGILKGSIFDAAGNPIRDTFVIDSSDPSGSFHGQLQEVAVSWDGGQYIVAHIELHFDPSTNTPTYPLFLSRVSEDGDVLENDILVAPDVERFTMASTDGTTLIVWSRDAAQARAYSSGVLSPPVSVIGAGPIAASPEGFFLAADAPSLNETTVQHFSAAGLPDSSATYVGTGVAQDVIWTGDRFLLNRMPVAPGAPLNTVVDAFTTAGQPMGSPPITIPLVAAVATVSGPNVIEFGSDLSFHEVDSLVLGTGTSHLVQRMYAAVNSLHAVWEGALMVTQWDEPEAYPEAYAVRSARNGAITTLPGFILFDVASNGQSTLSVVHDGSNLSTTTVSGPGAVLDSSRPPSVARIVWTGANYVVVWVSGSAYQLQTISAARVSSDGAILDGPFVFGTANYPTELTIAASTGAILVAYDDDRVIRGLLLDASGVHPTDMIAGIEKDATNLMAASDGENFIVSWIAKSKTPGVTNDYIGAQRLDSVGHAIPSDRFIYSPGNNIKTYQRVFWTGSDYLVVFTQLNDSGGLDLQAVRIARDGPLLDYPPLALGEISGSQVSVDRDPATGQLLVTYLATHDGVPGIYQRIVTFLRPRVVRW